MGSFTISRVTYGKSYLSLSAIGVTPNHIEGHTNCVSIIDLAKFFLYHSWSGERQVGRFKKEIGFTSSISMASQDGFTVFHFICQVNFTAIWIKICLINFFWQVEICCLFSKTGKYNSSGHQMALSRNYRILSKTVPLHFESIGSHKPMTI